MEGRIGLWGPYCNNKDCFLTCRKPPDMKRSFILLCCLMLMAVLPCLSQQSEHETHKIWKEGVALSMQALEAQGRNDWDLVDKLRRQSLEKFKDVFLADPSNPAVRRSLGHCFYLDKQFDNAITWFERANRVDGPIAVNYMEMGLSHIAMGRMPDGKTAIDKALQMDTTEAFRSAIVEDLDKFATVSASNARAFMQLGDKEKATVYKKMTISVLMFHLDYDKSDKSQKEVYDQIATLALEVDDKETADEYRKLAGPKPR